MRTEKIKQFEFIRNEDVEQFQNDLNKAMKRLKDMLPETIIKADGEILTAQIEYTETLTIEEPPATETGITFRCEDCPMFRPQQKRDGTPDARSKYGDCPHADFHRTWKSNQACEVLYRAIKNGDVRLGMTEAAAERYSDPVLDLYVEQ